MAKEKATITVDRARLDEARALVGATSASATIDIALATLIRQARIVQDVKAYSDVPLAPDELALLTAPADQSRGLEDETDWAALYAEES
jgi:hypothetical protein